MKRIYLFHLLFLSLTFFTLESLTAQEQGAKSGYYRWAFVKVDKDENISPIEEEKIDLEDFNSQLQIFFCPLKNSFLYLLLIGPDDDPTLLFPASFDDFSKYYDTFEHIPDVGPFEQPGRYELHILVTASRSKELEKLLGKYQRLKSQKEAVDEGSEAKDELLSVITKKRRQFHFAANKQKVFTGKGGANRVGANPLALYIERIDFKDLYAKTFIIEKK